MKIGVKACQEVITVLSITTKKDMIFVTMKDSMKMYVLNCSHAANGIDSPNHV